MRIVILLALFSSSLYAQKVDWQKLDQEMDYLKQKAFVVDQKKPTGLETSQLADPSKTSSTTRKTYSLKRKAKTPADPNILPLEQQYFDEINFKYSAPQRAEQKTTQKNQKQLSPVKPADSNVPKKFFEN